MTASASGTDVCVYCMTTCTVEQLKGFCMKGISPLVSGMKGNPVRTLADSIASEYLEAELDTLPFQGVESEPSASPFNAPPRTMTD